MTDAPIRTIVVEDDPDVVRLHVGYLAEVPGFVLVGTAATGAAAARLIAHSEVDLILLDVNLPDFSGVEVLHRLRAVRAWDVDVFVISSARDGFTVRQALAGHIVGYLAKPFAKEAFVRRLDEYRDLRVARSREEAVPLGQGDIDALVSGRAPGGAPRREPAASAPLPKGLSESTLRLVLESLDPVQPATVRDLAGRSGASTATVRRYLEHLVRTGAVDVSHRFGGRGRPEVLYRRALG